MTREEFIQETAKLEDMYNKKLNDTQLGFWFDELKYYDLEKYKRAVGEFAKYNSKMPALSDVLTKIKNLKTLGVDEPVNLVLTKFKCDTCNGSGLVKYFVKMGGIDYEYLCRCYCENAKQYKNMPIKDYQEVFYYRSSKEPMKEDKSVDFDISQINF